MNFTLYTANCIGNPQNSLYPDKVEINGADDMKAAVAYDHVCAEFRNSHRSSAEFLSADNIPMDCDNDHSDNPNDWVTPLEVAMAFPGVEFVVVYSRNHMLPKSGKTARPRFHVYFPISPITDSSEYTALKKRIAAEFPYFDKNALDSARLLFGVTNPQVEIYNGDMSIVDFLDNADFEKWDSDSASVPEGSRNCTMSHYAGRIIKRRGNTDEAYKQFLKQAEKCDPPLDDSELQTIWNSAVKFGKKVAKQDGYIPPEQYDSGFDLKPEDYSDIGQAKVLAREYSGELVFTDATDYMRYDGIRWAESKQLAVGACEDFLDKQLTEAKTALEKAQQALMKSGIDRETVMSGGKALEKAIDEKSEKAFAEYMAALVYKSFVMKRRDMKYITSALQAAKPMLLRDIKDFDSQEFLLNTPAVTYDLRTGTSSEHSADDLITKVTAVSPGDDGMDIWLEAVNSFFCGNDELIEYVQQIVGLAAIGKGNVTVKIDGIAASAASVIAMAGNKVLMSPVSMLMIHNPMTIAMGDSAEMYKAIDMLAEVKESIMNAYEIKTGMSRAKISHLMDAETWMNANKAVELGFADGILAREEPMEEQPANALMYSEAQVVNSLMGRIAEKCRIAPKTEHKTKAEDLFSRLDLIRNWR